MTNAELFKYIPLSFGVILAIALMLYLALRKVRREMEADRRSQEEENAQRARAIQKLIDDAVAVVELRHTANVAEMKAENEKTRKEFAELSVVFGNVLIELHRASFDLLAGTSPREIAERLRNVAERKGAA